MRTLPDGMLDTWIGGEFTGPNRHMARVTIQRMHIQLQKVDPEKLFSTAMFGQGDIPVELPNVKSVEWTRSIGSDVATATIVFYNTEPLPLGSTPVTSGDLDLPGSYTFNYGATTWSASRWGHSANQWQDLITPDRLLRTYEGYGFDATVIPEHDTHLVETGLWLIDDVEFTHDGLITVTARDIGRLLLDQIMFPPVIPLANYPLQFRKFFQTPNPPVVTTTGGGSHPSYSTDSGVPYGSSSVSGHHAGDAFDGSDGTYWMSVGNDRPNGPYSYEFIEGTTSGTLSAVTFKVWGGPYRVFVSVKVGGVWQGRALIPYDPDNPISAPNGANIRYVRVSTVAREGTGVFAFATPYTSVQAVRLTFTNLYNSGIGPFPYRAGVRDFRISSSHTTTTPGGTHQDGEYGDYSQIVKYLLATGGFHWPRTNQAYLTYSDGSTVSNAPPSDDPYLKSGRVWGDIEMSGTAGVSPLGVEIFDKKPLMDGISYVRDILGFIFFIEETGGAVFRLPNVWKIGNFVGNDATDAGFTTDVLTIDEKQTLIGLRAKLSSRNIREHVFISNTTGKIGAVAAGYNPITPDPGLRRVAGWTDQNFTKVAECQTMADLITVRQMFEYRSDSLQIVACPAIQIDDQVRIYERTTNEGYLHYIKSIKSTNDLEAGKWTYDLDTHWLGEEPYAKWAVNPASLSAATQEFLAALGRLA